MQIQEMTEDNFEVFKNKSLAAYSADLSKEAKIPLAEANVAAAKQFQTLLPEQIKTPDHFFYQVYDSTGDAVGYLWFSIRQNLGKKRIFICDIFIEEKVRNKGFGTFVLSWLEEKTIELGYSEIALHAFAHNKNAIKLYETFEYKLSNVHMVKTLSYKKSEERKKVDSAQLLKNLETLNLLPSK